MYVGYGISKNLLKMLETIMYWKNLDIVEVG